MTSYLNENEATCKNLQNGSLIADFGMEYVKNHFGALKSVMTHVFAFFTLFHLGLTFFSPSVSL